MFSVRLLAFVIFIASDLNIMVASDIGDKLKNEDSRLHQLYDLRKFEECLNGLNSIIETPKPDSLLRYDFGAYIMMSDIFRHLETYVLAEEAIEKSNEILGLIKEYDVITFRRLEPRYHLARGALALERDNIVLAVKEWEECQRNLTPKNEIEWYALGGSIYQATGDMEKSDNYFNRALSSPQSNPNKINILIRCVGKEIASSNFTGAYKLLERYDSLTVNLADPSVAMRLSYLRGAIYGGLGRWEEATGSMVDGYIIADSLIGADNRLKNRLLAQRISPDDYSALQKDYRHHSLTNRYLLTAALAVIIILLLVVCIVVVLRNRLYRESVEIKSEAAKRDSLHQHRLDSLTQKVRDREKELCTISMEAAQTEATIKTIKSQILNAPTSPEDNLQKIKETIRDSVVSSQAVKTFKTQFDSINQRLYDRLAARHPNLTRAEINMAAYILLNLNAKEIAQLTNRSVRTVDTIKYNLRKKLNVSRSTAVYLREIMRDDSQQPTVGSDG